MGTDGFEFIEYAAPDPIAMGKVFESLGFTAIAKHRTKNVTLYRQGAGYPAFPESMAAYLRLPAGHPEGFHEALANLHKTIQLQIRRKDGEEVPDAFPHPDVVDGAAGIALIEAAVESSRNDGAWTDVAAVSGV